MLWKNINTINKKQQYFQDHLLGQRMRILALFLEKFSKLPSKAVFLYSYSENCTSSVPNYKPPPERTKCPNSLRVLYTKNNLNLNKNELNLIVNGKFENLKLSMPDIDYVERLTKSATNGIKLDKGV